MLVRAPKLVCRKGFLLNGQNCLVVYGSHCNLLLKPTHYLHQVSPMYSIPSDNFKLVLFNQVVIAQWLAWRLATGDVLGLSPGKGENLLISD